MIEPDRSIAPYENPLPHSDFLSVEQYSLDPEQFAGMLAATVSEPMLLSDRKLQATLDKIFDYHFTHDKEHQRKVGDRRVLLLSPYPVIALRREGGVSFQYGVFLLKERQHWYYFDAGSPIEDVPPYLRPQDVVPSRAFRLDPPGEPIPFNKPLNRVLRVGGIAEQYNYVKERWEPNGRGEYSPNVKGRVLYLADRARAVAANLTRSDSRSIIPVSK